jgi:hypothetical protein
MSGYLYNSLNTSIISNNPKPPVLDNADLESHLLLMVDTANINCYSLVNGTHTIKNMVDLSVGTIVSSNLTNQGTLGFQFSHTDSRILLPTVTNARSIVFWYKVNSLPGTAFILDARTGSANSYITSYGGGDVEGAFLGISLEIFTGPTSSINTLTDANVTNLLFNSTGGWKMVILNPLTPITDDITFLNRYQDFFYGLFANIGPILIFDKAITDTLDKSYLYNLFASRYGLAEIPSIGGIPTSLLQSKILIESTLPSASSGKYRLTSSDFDGIINLSQVNTESYRRSILKSTIQSLFTIANDPSKNVLDLTTNSLQVDISALPFPSQITKSTVDILENNQSVNLSTFTTNNTALYCILDSSGDYLRVNTLTSFIEITNISNGEFKVETGNPSSITTVSEGESDTFDGFFYVLGSITGQSSGENTVVCLHPDTLILMSNYEYKPIHSIREGEYVMSLYGSSQVQKKLYMKSTMSHNYPYRIPKDYFQKNMPMEDLIISPNHRMLIENQMISCQMMKHHHSLNGLTQIKEQKEHEYYHLKLEHSNSLMNANGVWVDSNQREILPESRF